ncbi:DNA replication regulator SLD3-domain-containing protein [Sphaerosporella brunnea]|uniref:DNA replication regulator SLD3-domain-containing protein n=1 Tax=Sphaerosporella brunnea TaxID=1250544 RepID=A0A5J5EZ22_9PEZI|nr:DNA replication regulator SLD3-domain-containing protein [Sphaerosporella brunnea]
MFAPPLPPSSSKKRKRGEDKPVIGSPFIVQPHPTSSFDVSTKISPTVVIPRSHIPMSWLAGAPSRLFDVPTESPAIAQPGYVVVVKIEGERQLSAVENVGGNVYAIYRLSTQLRMKDIRKVASQTKHLLTTVPSNYDLCEREWWSEVGSVEYPFGDSPVNVAALDMGIGIHDVVVEQTAMSSHAPIPPPPPPPKAEKHIDAIEVEGQPALCDILDQVRRQYFDTLYLAKTSLAYFAKSTLSRARATCRGSDQPPLRARFDELAEYLRKLMLPLDKMDLKYRKCLIQCVLENESGDPTVFRPVEDGYVQRWRQSTFQDRFVKENDPELKHKLEELRIRETELQIILLLEILALNKEHPPAVVEAEEETKGKKGKGKSKKKKKSKDAAPDVLLDLLVDRLCIWHSIGSDTSAEKGELPTKGKVSEKDHLRHFSVEVIMAL